MFKKSLFLTVLFMGVVAATVTYESRCAALDVQSLVGIQGSGNCLCVDVTTCKRCNLNNVKCTASTLTWECFDEATASEYCNLDCGGDPVECGRFLDCDGPNCTDCEDIAGCLGCGGFHWSETPCT